MRQRKPITSVYLFAVGGDVEINRGSRKRVYMSASFSSCRRLSRLVRGMISREEATVKPYTFGWGCRVLGKGKNNG